MGLLLIAIGVLGLLGIVWALSQERARRRLLTRDKDRREQSRAGEQSADAWTIKGDQ